MRDEQAQTDHLENVCGSVANAQRLFRIYKDSYPSREGMFKVVSKEKVFAAKAKRDGFTQRQIDALLACQ